MDKVCPWCEKNASGEIWQLQQWWHRECYERFGKEFEDWLHQSKKAGENAQFPNAVNIIVKNLNAETVHPNAWECGAGCCIKCQGY